MKKHTFFKAALIFTGVTGLIAASWFAKKIYKSSTKGTITVEVVDLDDITIARKEIKFFSGDTLQKIVEENFDKVIIKNGMILSIESIVTPDDWSTFISIYKNEVLSDKGISDIEFVTGDTISFINTVFNYDF